MINIQVPSQGYEEYKYVIEVIFDSFLNLPFQIQREESLVNVKIILANGKFLEIKDYFFSQKMSGYTKDMIPKQISYLDSNKYNSFKKIPVIFGQPEITEVNGGITCEVDLLSSIFFMLTRWEESTFTEVDNYKRFPDELSLAVTFNFFQRPVVNEYVDLLYQILKHLGLKSEKVNRDFEIYLTHDVDCPLRWGSIKQIIKALYISFLHKRDLKLFCNHIFDIFQTKLTFRNKLNDVYNTFGSIMDIAESIGTKCYFFFLSGGRTRYDYGHSMGSKFMLSLYEEINKRGHVSGYHPSYMTYNNANKFRKGWEVLSKNNPYALKLGRQHYLRFKAPVTWRIWDEQGFVWSSTLSFNKNIGFRGGTCYAFPVFDFVNSKKLNLIERPLLVMDSCMDVWGNLDKSISDFKKIVKEVKKHNGDFVFLWHNSFVDPEVKLSFAAVYKKFVNSIIEISE